ncbi:MAG: flavodoxin domain-containing protein [Bacteroidota bacterium]
MEALDLSTAYPDVLLLVGTQTGHAEWVAEELAEALDALGFDVDLQLMMDAEAALLEDASQLVICTSTHGQGALPEGSQPLFDALAEGAPDLAHVAFGVVALGDHAYEPHFIAAARQWQRLLKRCGALEATDPYVIDQGPTRDDLEGVASWGRRLATAFAAAFADEPGELRS